MNVRLLRRIAKVIQEKPREFDMRFLHGKNDKETWEASCGTAHCICGWAAVLRRDDDIQNTGHGRDVFDIDWTEANRLFFLRNWPEPFRTAYGRRVTKFAKARIAADRIEHFIKTKGAE